MSTPKRITARYLLLVEGRDDEIFLKNFLETRNYAGIQVEAYGGVSNFRNFLPVLVITPGFDRVAIACRTTPPGGEAGEKTNIRFAPLQGV